MIYFNVCVLKFNKKKKKFSDFLKWDKKKKNFKNNNLIK